MLPGPAYSYSLPLVSSAVAVIDGISVKPEDAPDNGDRIARHRRKRAADLLDRSVAGFDDVTLKDVLRSVIAATDESGGRLDVDRFLTERGHTWQTVELVLTCLTFVDTYVSCPPPPKAL
jgi:hypothetical protein